MSVPDVDWARIVTGDKRMLRSYSLRRQPLALSPTPAVAWRRHLLDGFQAATVWIEETYEEPLGVISAEDLALEGFADLPDFRRYFEERYPQHGYRPLSRVQVYRLRPITADDVDEYAGRLLAHLGYVLP